MITATYPIIHSTDRLELFVGLPESDPLSQHGDMRCLCSVQHADYRVEFYAHGVDDMQCIWLSMKRLQDEIRIFEEKTNLKCEYTFFEEERFMKT